MRAARWELYRLEQAQLERARLEHLRLEQYWLEYARLEQAWQEEGFIMLPTLPNNEPDKHRTLRHYHHEPMKWIHGSPHANYSEGKYHNPRYITPDTNSPWTGAEDSLLLEQIPHAKPPGTSWNKGTLRLRDNGLLAPNCTPDDTRTASKEHQQPRIYAG